MLLLTLAAEQALSREDWHEADALMARRGSILNRLEGMSLNPQANAYLDQVQRLEASLLGRMNAQRSSIVGEIINERRQGQAADLYRRAG
jgi:hypothetical protein